MKDNFTICTGSEAHASVGYSSMVPGDVLSAVVHGFPNLTYKDTISMKSDPEIVVNHDRVTEITNSMNLGGGPQRGLIAAVIVIAAVGAVGAVVFLKKRKKQGKRQ